MMSEGYESFPPPAGPPAQWGPPREQDRVQPGQWAQMPTHWPAPPPSPPQTAPQWAPPVPGSGFGASAYASPQQQPLGTYMAAHYTAEDLIKHPVNGAFLNGVDHLWDPGSARGIDGWGRRGLTWIIDFVVTFVLAGLLTAVFRWGTYYYLVMPLIWGGNRWLLAWRCSGSVGHLAMRARIFVPLITRDGQLWSMRAGPVRLFLRDVVQIADLLTLGIVFPLNPQKRSIGDMVTGTWVIDARSGVEFGKRPHDPTARRYWMPAFLTTKIETRPWKVDRNTRNLADQQERERQAHLARVAAMHQHMGGQGSMTPERIVALDNPGSAENIARAAFRKMTPEEQARLEQEQRQTLNRWGE